MIIYKGLGFLVPLLTVVAAMFSSALGDKFIFPVATVLCLTAWLILKGKREAGADTFFFIPLGFWPPILAVVSLFYIFIL